MSYILDALKKLENEKTRKNRGAGMLSISGELFKDERRPVSGGNVWKLVAVVVVASVVTFGATWFFLKSDKVKDGANPHNVAPLPVARPVPSTILPVEPIRQPTSTMTKNVPIVAPTTPVPVHEEVSRVVPVKAPATPAVHQQGKRQNMLKKQPPQAAQPAQPGVATIPAPSDIKVSGIAWQDEHSARRAVVNGFLMQEGSSVAGAKIVEIYQDRVRFSQAGSFFEVNLLASGLPGTAK